MFTFIKAPMANTDTILVTGAAGFIGYHFSERVLQSGAKVLGLDNMNDYYEVSLKESRVALLEKHQEFTFIRGDLADRDLILKLFEVHKPTIVVNLGAQAGVRHSLENPHAYVDSNIQGFMNILEGCRHHPVKHLVYASSSSVYGANTKMPFSTGDDVDHPVSLYAASKKANELMAHTYSHLYAIPTTGLRFFTVYGPWGRPDMAIFLFTRAILSGKPIRVFNFSDMRRDFTYIDDIIEGMTRICERIPSPLSSPSINSRAPYKIYNIGNNKPVKLTYFIDVLEDALGKKAIRELLPMQPGDVESTYADIDDLAADVGFSPKTSVEDGVKMFVEWYRGYYRD